MAFLKDDFPLLTQNKRGLNNGTYFVPMGRVVGGGSTINAMFFLRCPAVDYDSWEKLGNRGWGWQGLLPYFKKVCPELFSGKKRPMLMVLRAKPLLRLTRNLPKSTILPGMLLPMDRKALCRQVIRLTTTSQVVRSENMYCPFSCRLTN